MQVELREEIAAVRRDLDRLGANLGAHSSAGESDPAEEAGDKFPPYDSSPGHADSPGEAPPYGSHRP